MVGEIFQKVLDMSLIGCYSILIVMAVRMILSKCGRKYAYYLWFAVFFNLCIPFSFRGIFSLIPDSVAEFSLTEAVGDALEGGQQEGTDPFIIPQISDGMQSPADGSHILAKDQTENMGYFPQTSKERKVFMFYGIYCTIWLAGIAVILVWSLSGTFRLKKWIARENWIRFDQKRGIAEVAGLDTPFLWGVIRPIIYLPAGMEEEEMQYVVAHEQYHRRRRDYLVKIAVFFVAAVHWFNPLVWAAYALFCKDMEISCDEAVLQRFDGNIKKQYAGSLLKYAAGQSGLILTPITFGEPAVKSRIKNVLYFKKRGIVISALAVICAVSVAAGLVLRPSAEEAAPENRNDPSQRWEIQDDSEANVSTAAPAQPAQGEEDNENTENKNIENRDAEDKNAEDKDTEDKSAENKDNKDKNPENKEDIVLTDQNKELLQIMCVYLPEFSGNLTEADEDFWKSFIFRAFTGTPMDENGNYVPIYGEGEYVVVYREDLGFMDGEFKISERYVKEYAWLILGVEMPKIRPAYEDMQEGQTAVYYRDGSTALYYEDGYYYIPVSDFGEEQYRFRDLEVIQEPWMTYAYVYYDMLMYDGGGDQVTVGTVTFELSYADNINGFVITGKNTERR